MQRTTRLVAGIFGRTAALALAVGLLLRIALLLNEQTASLDFTPAEWAALFLCGALNDLCVALLGFAPLLLWLASVTERKYARPWGGVLLGILLALLALLLFGDTAVHQYGSAALRVARAVAGYWAASFALRLFLPRLRPRWTRTWFFLLTILYVGAILFDGVAEYLFWNEFGVRYNFIAVDYLVYTHEVVGNIVESYPVAPILAVLLVATTVVRQLLFGRFRRIEEALGQRGWRRIVLPLYAAAALSACGLLHLDRRCRTSSDIYANELRANGIESFCDAFFKNELDYDRFYPTLPTADIEHCLRSLYGGAQGVRRAIRPEGGELRRNIVLISIESMSASFLARYGNTQHLTPVLDSLCGCGLVFDRLYATGNRTVRGLEALTLSLPPAAGQSLIKRPNNTHCVSVGEILAAKGYDVLYFYGGNSYFDNMAAFFGGNGYRIVDRKSYAPDEVVFSNIWGVSDEDAYRKAIRTLDTLARGGRPFFAHLMTVSNHRPYTYPEGHIAIPPSAKSRAGGVMYSDYALGEFFRAAAREPWFAQTIFLVTADHCASSAGKTELPLANYHIPAVILAPGLVEPQVERRIVSQIDLMPTLLGLLGMRYESPFYGRDIYREPGTERAFVATYRDLGCIEGDLLTILSPVRRIVQYDLRPTADDSHRTVPHTGIDSVRAAHAVAYYRSAARLAKETDGKRAADSDAPFAAAKGGA